MMECFCIIKMFILSDVVDIDKEVLGTPERKFLIDDIVAAQEKNIVRP